MGKNFLEGAADVATLGAYGAVTGKGAFEVPEAPDYTGAAEATAAGNLQQLEAQTRANRPDQYNPWGSVTWQQDADGGWSQKTELNEESQQSFDAQQAMQLGRSELGEGMMGRLKSEYSDAMDWSQYGDQTELEFDPTEMRQKAEDASYARATSRLDPRFAKESEALEIKLRNQGLSRGDRAYDAAINSQNMNKEDAYSNARSTSVLEGRGESSQLWDQQKGTADYANNLRQNQMKEDMQKRGFSLNEINGIMSGQQVGLPSFTPFNQSGRVAGPDYLGAANSQSNFDQANYQAQMGMYGDIAGAGGSMFGAA